MKKLFFLSAIALLIGASSFAQPGPHKHRKHHRRHHHHPHPHPHPHTANHN